MRIETTELIELWESSLMTKRRPKRTSIDRRLSHLRRSMRTRIDTHMQAPMVLLDEATRFLMAFEDFQFFRPLSVNNREFALHTARLRADVLAIREMIGLGQESAALALARVFFENPAFIRWGLGVVLGFACMRCAGFKAFWPLALAGQASVAITFAALRRFCGAALFRGPRPSSRLGAPFWPSGLTIRRSRPLRGG